MSSAFILGKFDVPCECARLHSVGCMSREPGWQLHLSLQQGNLGTLVWLPPKPLILWVQRRNPLPTPVPASPSVSP